MLDAENGYVLAPMEQGIRITTGVEFAAARRAANAGAIRPAVAGAREPCFRLGRRLSRSPGLARGHAFPNSRPVIGRAPGQRGLWLAIGHAHWGLTLGPVTGRLIAEMMTGATPFCDPKPYGPDRFSK